MARKTRAKTKQQVATTGIMITEPSYLPHPLSEIFPLAPVEDMITLAESIRDQGLIEPITLFDGQILDGRNRVEACARASVVPRFEKLSADKDPLAFVIAKNLARRHLTIGQRAIVASRIANLSHGGARTGESQDANLRLEKAAATLGVSPRSVSTARQIERDCPKLATEVFTGRISLNTADTLKSYDRQVLEQTLERGPEALEHCAEDVRAKDRRHERKHQLSEDFSHPSDPSQNRILQTVRAIIFGYRFWVLASNLSDLERKSVIAKLKELRTRIDHAECELLEIPPRAPRPPRNDGTSKPKQGKPGKTKLSVIK